MLVKQVHPDLNPDRPNAAKEFKEITEAYKLLTNDNLLNIVQDVMDEERAVYFVRVFSAPIIESRRVLQIEELLKAAGID